MGENFTVGGGSTVADLRVTGVSTFVGLMNINGGAEIGDLRLVLPQQICLELPLEI